MNGKELRELVKSKQNGCDHKCESCGLFQGECLFVSLENTRKKQIQRHKDFAKKLKNFGGNYEQK